MKYLLITYLSFMCVASMAQITEAAVRSEIDGQILTNNNRINTSAKLREVLHYMLDYVNSKANNPAGLIRFCVPEISDNTGALNIPDIWTEIPEFSFVVDQSRNYWVDIVFTTIFGTGYNGTVDFKLATDNVNTQLGRVLDQSAIAVNVQDGTTVRRSLSYDNQFDSPTSYPYQTGDTRTMQHIAGYLQNATASDTVRFYLRAAPGTTFNLESNRKMCVNGY